MKEVLVLLVLYFPGLLKAQKQGFYNVKGKFICDECSLKNIATDSGYKNYGLCTLPKPYESNIIVYEYLSNTPLVVGKHGSATIEGTLKAFKKKPYYSSYRFFDDIERMIKERQLYDLFLLKSIGKPSSVSETSDGNNKTQVWTYDKYGLTVYFVNSLAVRYDRHSL